jgi:hypothetical protein
MMIDLGTGLNQKTSEFWQCIVECRKKSEELKMNQPVKTWGLGALLVSSVGMGLWLFAGDSKLSDKELAMWANERIRNPAQNDELKTFDLARSLRTFEAFLDRGTLDADNCGPAFRSVFSEIFNVDSESLNPTTLREESLELIQKLWSLRLKLRTRFESLVGAAAVSQECVDALRDVMKAGRFMGDYLGTIDLKAPLNPEAHVSRPFEGPPGYTEINSQFAQAAALQPGDVLLSRGAAFTSAAIARLAVPASQFSHLAIVYRPQGTQDLWTVEAHIEVGAVVAPLEKYLSDKKIRSLVFRHRDSKLAEQAGLEIADRVAAAQKDGKNLCYDFFMDSDNHDCLFCSELVAYGFELASKGTFRMPMFPTLLDQKFSYILKKLGASTSKTFLPADIELDPRFDLVKEWRDYARLRESHLKDAVLTSMYRWMADKDYRLAPTPKSILLGHLVHPIRKDEDLSNLIGLNEKFPTNMPRETFETVIEIESTAKKIAHALEVIDQTARAERGLGLTPKEIYEELEQLRIKDLAARRAGGPMIFHDLFYPKSN